MIRPAPLKGPFSVNLSLKLAKLHVKYDGDIRGVPLWGECCTKPQATQSGCWTTLWPSLGSNLSPGRSHGEQQQREHEQCHEQSL
eukprot:SAG11_NODE_1524_length_4746_cov_5.271358_1_plen_84_part_10